MIQKTFNYYELSFTIYFYIIIVILEKLISNELIFDILSIFFNHIIK